MSHAAATFTKRITTTYLGALAVLAALAVVGYHLPQAELKYQQTSAAVLNLIDRQDILLERTALLAEHFLKTSDDGQRARLREELEREAREMEEAQTRLHRADPRLAVPAELDRQVHEHIANVRRLLELPSSERTAGHPLSKAIFAQATGRLSDDLESLALAYQRLDAAGIQQLRRTAAGLLAVQLGTLALLGWCVFRPLVRRIQQEHDERLRSERLAVIGTMAAKFAHEIRNPLGSIRLNLDSLRENLAGNHAPALLGSIDSELRRIQRVSSGYLKFARLPKGTYATIALNEWLAQQLQICAAEFAHRRIRLDTQFVPTLPAVRADGAQLWQAMLNIIHNAWEAMPDGGALTIRTAFVRPHVRLEIADTGHGMNEEQSQRLFQPFFSSKKGGTGLGLALTQQIILEHGGRITCASRPGAGTTFCIELPCSKETPVEQPTTSRRPNASDCPGETS